LRYVLLNLLHNCVLTLYLYNGLPDHCLTRLQGGARVGVKLCLHSNGLSKIRHCDSLRNWDSNCIALHSHIRVVLRGIHCEREL